MEPLFSKRACNRFKGLTYVTEASRRKEVKKALWVMRGMCPDGFIVTVKGAVFWGRGAAQLQSSDGDGGGTFGRDATCGEQRWENGT